LETDAEINSFVYSVIRGIQKIKSMHAQSRIYAKWAVLYQKRLRLSLDPPVIMKLRGVFLTFLTSLCTVVLLSFAAGDHAE
jgi:ABC-type bacteriocin/lantibiotic exporter with double-glycine peptidase domain